MIEPTFAMGITGEKGWNIYMTPSLEKTREFRDEFTMLGTSVSEIRRLDLPWYIVFERVVKRGDLSSLRDGVHDYYNPENNASQAVLLYTSKINIFPEVEEPPIEKRDLVGD